jgi:hypothetical protein
VRRLATEFPDRVTGTPQDEAAARWVGDELRALGMAVAEQRFRAYGASSLDDWGWHDGLNVVGVHRGAVDDAIVFGAHRDVVATTEQGADDNGSGTGTLLELARALTATPHHHTFVFVSFGAEEIGLGGAAYFANHWPGMARVRLMLNFDMLGWRHAAATRIEHWSFLSLPATALLYGMVAREPGVVAPDRSKTLWRVAGAIDDPGSDSAVFALRGYPTLFFADGPPRPDAPRHCYHEACDTLEQVSAEALGRAGRFAEEFVRRVDGGGYLDSAHAFLVQGERYVPVWQVWGVGIAVALFALAQLGLAALALTHPRSAAGLSLAARLTGCASWPGLKEALRGPAIYWVGALSAAVLVALAAPLPGLGAAPSPPRVLAWLGVAAIALIALLALRRRCRAAPPAVERLAFTAALIASYLAVALVTNLLLAGLAALPHLLLSSQVRQRPARRWQLVDLAIVAPGCLWSAFVLTAGTFMGVFQWLPPGMVLPGIGLAYLGAAAPLAAVLARGKATSSTP